VRREAKPFLETQKSPTYPVQINDLGYFRKHEMTLNVSET
jgi:hypothetical protein